MVLFHPMRAYEMMAVLPVSADSDNEKKREEAISKLLATSGAKVKELTFLGKKTLAYPINKQTEGVYVLVTLEADRLDVAQIEKQARLGGGVMRYLVTAKG